MKYPSEEALWKILEQSTREDFDGHTNFRKLNPDQRIQWASMSAMAVFHAKEWRRQNGLKEHTSN